MARRGRPPVLKNRTTTCIGIERNDLMQLRNRGIDLSELVRKTVKEVLSENRAYKLKQEAKQLRESIKSDTLKLELIEKELKILDEEILDNEAYLKRTPVNQASIGSVFHHMHLETMDGIDHEIGIYIPYDLHHSIGHSSISGKGMKEINKASLLWLCEQDTI